MSIRRFAFGIFVTCLFCSATLFSADQPTSRKRSAATTECKEGLQTVPHNNGAVSEFSSLFETYSLEDLVSTDPQRNLAVRYPTVLMDAFQKAWFRIKLKPARTIKDPTYRVQNVKYWPAFHDGGPETSGQMIIGQHRAVETIVDYIYKGALGDTSAMKMLLLRGPGGTGKTEVLNVLTNLQANLPHLDPLYRELTFEWVGLSEIPEFKPLVVGEGDDSFLPLKNTMQRSPLVLLPRSVQDRVLALGRERARELIGMQPRPFQSPDPQTKRIIEALMKYYARKAGVTQITEDFYLKTLAKHVVIKTRLLDPAQPPHLIRYQGKTPEFHQLFFDENLLAMAIYGSDDPLSYRYGGKVIRADGGALGLDEFFRNGLPFRDYFLEIAQNRVAERGGAPAVNLDVVLLATSNDESIANAMDDGGAQAQLDRTVRLPVRLAIHPLEVAKTTVHMVGIKNFQMRSLNSQNSQRASAELNALFPLPEQNGNLAGPDGRYAVYYGHAEQGQQPILVAPNSLMMLALTVAGSRLVTDPQTAAKYKDEIDLIRQNHSYFTDVTSRLQILLGELKVSNSHLLELVRIKDLLKEGEWGISARDAQTWLAEALSAAESNDHTLTPAVIDQTFLRLLDADTIKTPNDLRARWIHIHNLVKRHFILPRLAKDINSIISGGGEGSRVDHLYQELKREIIALGTNPETRDYEDNNGDRRAINHNRFLEIAKIYHEVNGRELITGEIKDFHVNHSDAHDQFLPLVRAIERYLLRKEIDTASVDQLMDALDGRSNRPESVNLLQRVEHSVEKLGYNRRALMEALRFIRDVQRTENAH